MSKTHNENLNPLLTLLAPREGGGYNVPQGYIFVDNS